MNDVQEKRCANSSGRTLEVAVGAWLSAFNIQFHRNEPIRHSRGSMSNAIYPDFSCPKVNDGVFIECRRQESAGSADKKSGIILVDVEEGRYGKPVIVVVSGKASESIYEFFKNRESPGLRCMNMNEFLCFCEEASEGEWSPLPKSYDPRQRGLWD